MNGIDIRSSGGKLLLIASLKDADGNKVTTGTTEVRIYRVINDGMADGAFETLDWSDYPFDDTLVSDDEGTLTHQQHTDGDTGIWTLVLSGSQLADISAGDQLIVQVTNSNAVPESQERWFQWGGVDGDTATAAALATAQDDLDIITGADGVTLATAQANYAPAKAGDEMDLVDAPNATAVTAIQNGLATSSEISALESHGDTTWATATGFSTHSAADVVSAMQAVANDFKADVTGLALETSLQGLITTVGAAGAGLTEAGGTGDQFTGIASVGAVSGAVGSVTGNVGGNVVGTIGGLATQAKADVNTEVDAAIETYHLDHLFAAAYDPTSKPGNASGLLNVLVENDGGVPRYTTNALEQAPSGGGEGSTVVVSPIVGVVTERVEDTTISLYVGEAIPVTVTVVDSNGDAVDLSTLGDLRVCIEPDNGTDKQVVEHASLTISGASSNMLTFTVSSAVTAAIADLPWSLRVVSTGRVIVKGTVEVRDVALKDA